MAQRHLDADPRMLRAIAHPLRSALLYELHARGSANATTLAAAVARPVNAVSFHLRQLAKYELIEEDPDGAGDGRERWWRPAGPEGLHVHGDALRGSAAGRAALEVFRRHGEAYWHALVERFWARAGSGSAGPSEEVWAANDVPMQLSDEEARQYAEEVYAVMRRWHEHGQGTPPEGQQRRTYLGTSMVMPHQTDLVGD
jgi:DNA-binding transcriptional ArsR family regulator